jgi:cytochrome c553
MNRETRRRIFDAAVWLGGALFLAALAVDAAAGERRAYTASDPAWRNECGSCHIAYPPQMLGASSWRTIMQGLDGHFGTDASLDAATATPILAFLEAHAGPDEGKRGSGGAARITETRWFRHEHDEIAAAVWSRKEVRSRANCAACHRDADRGDFNERTVRVPR